MQRFQILFFIVLAILSVVAYSDNDHEEARHLKEAGKILPLQEIIKKAQIEHPGRVIEVEMESKNDRIVYEVELLDENGEVWELYFDAATGELVKRERED